MTLNDLYDIAEREGVEVYSFDLMGCESLSVMENGNCAIAIDPFKLSGTADERVKLAHELGHCVTGSFYNQYAACDIRGRHERRADRWAIQRIIPEDELKRALKYECRNRWELSEYFSVTEDFMQKALDYYMGEM